MKQGGIFAVELKRQIDDELLSGIYTPAQLTNHNYIVTVLPTHIARGSRLLYGKTAVEDIGIVL
jgi:hypothetical protein